MLRHACKTIDLATILWIMQQPKNAKRTDRTMDGRCRSMAFLESRGSRRGFDARISFIDTQHVRLMPRILRHT